MRMVIILQHYHTYLPHSQSSLILDDQEPEEDILTYMQHNFGNEIKNHMKDTVFSRRTYIRRLHQTGQFHLESIMNIMPRLFDTEGMVGGLFLTFLLSFK